MCEQHSTAASFHRTLATWRKTTWVRSRGGKGRKPGRWNLVEHMVPISEKMYLEDRFVHIMQFHYPDRAWASLENSKSGPEVVTLKQDRTPPNPPKPKRALGSLSPVAARERPQFPETRAISHAARERPQFPETRAISHAARERPQFPETQTITHAARERPQFAETRAISHNHGTPRDDKSFVHTKDEVVDAKHNVSSITSPKSQNASSLAIQEGSPVRDTDIMSDYSSGTISPCKLEEVARDVDMWERKDVKAEQVKIETPLDQSQSVCYVGILEGTKTSTMSKRQKKAFVSGLELLQHHDQIMNGCFGVVDGSVSDTKKIRCHHLQPQDL